MLRHRVLRRAAEVERHIEKGRRGREGGDVSDAEVVVVAVPGGAIAEALNNVQ